MAKKQRKELEIATGAVNGVNTIFTTINSITRIEQLLVNSSHYAQFSFSGNTIVLDDAPSVGTVEVTYEYETDKDYLDNSGWIVGETCTGESDGTNRVFTTFFPISSIDEVRVNGIAVVGYSFKGNSILLATAPSVTHKVAVDYFRADYGVVDYDRTNYPTLLELRTKVYNEISQDDTSVQYQEELVNDAIKAGVNEMISVKTDKSRDIAFSLSTAGKISIAPVANSISSFTISSTVTLPPIGRILTKDGEFIDYTSIANGVITIINLAMKPSSPTEGYVGYRLPRNYRRIKRVFGEYERAESAGVIDFLKIRGGFLINNGFIYFSTEGIYTLEAEMKELVTSDDDSLIYIDEEDVDVVVYYALRQLYSSRENDKLLSTSQLFADKLNSYKRKMGKKRSQLANGKAKTAIGLY